MKTTRLLIALIVGLGLILTALVTLSPLQVSQANPGTPERHDNIQGLSLWREENNLQSRPEQTAAEESLPPCPLDVYFLIDLTGSFGGEVAAFDAAAPVLISTLLVSNPNTRFGLAGFQDYPYSTYGAPDDKPYERIVDLTFDTQALYDGISGLTIGDGGDQPESQLPALYQTATGAGDGPYVPPNQQASFRGGATKLIVLWTDAPFHRDYGSIPGAYPPSFTQAVTAIHALGFSKVVGISSGGGGLIDLQDIAQATGGLAPAGGVDCDNDGFIDVPAAAPLVCVVGDQGEGINEAIVALIEASTECRILLPMILNSWSSPCVGAGEEMSMREYDQGMRCCSGLGHVVTERYLRPCDTPGELACDVNGCTIPPPTDFDAPWFQCSPCGNSVCETEHGENRCNCLEDCQG